MDRIVVKWAGKFAVLISAITLILGAYIGWEYNAAWFSRFGSIVIIAGVLLAILRIDERVHSMVEAFSSQYFPASIDKSISLVRKSGGGLLLEAEQIKLHEQSLRSLNAFTAEYARKKQRLIGRLEVYIVCLGTLVNGFGEAGLHALKTACT